MKVMLGFFQNLSNQNFSTHLDQLSKPIAIITLLLPPTNSFRQCGTMKICIDCRKYSVVKWCS